jgi:hypothetical protein
MADLKISQLTSATTPLAGTEVLPIVQSSSTKKVATDDLTVKNVRSNATTGILQIAGPGTGATRTMTTPNANFTVARTDAAQTFTGNQTFEAGSGFGTTEDVLYVKNLSGSTAISRLKFGTAALADSGAIGVYTQDASNGALIIWAKSSGTLTQVAYANSDLTFHVNSNNLVFDTAAKGINFTANTPAAGMTSQLLNWYEEGTWTPTLTTNGFSGGVTLSSAAGVYTRVGRQVTAQCTLTLSGFAYPSAYTEISGLPFTSLARSAGSYVSAHTNQGAACGVVNGGTVIFLYPALDTGTSTVWTFAITYSV